MPGRGFPGSRSSRATTNAMVGPLPKFTTNGVMDRHSLPDMAISIGVVVAVMIHPRGNSPNEIAMPCAKWEWFPGGPPERVAPDAPGRLSWQSMLVFPNRDLRWSLSRETMPNACVGRIPRSTRPASPFQNQATRSLLSPRGDPYPQSPPHGKAPQKPLARRAGSVGKVFPFAKGISSYFKHPQ